MSFIHIKIGISPLMSLHHSELNITLPMRVEDKLFHLTEVKNFNIMLRVLNYVKLLRRK